MIGSKMERGVCHVSLSVLRCPFVCVLVQLACYFVCFDCTSTEQCDCGNIDGQVGGKEDSLLECVPLQAALITGLSCTGGPVKSQCVFCGLSKRLGQYWESNAFNFLPDCMWQWETAQFFYFSWIFGLWLQISKVGG